MSTLLLSEVVEEKEKPHFLTSAYVVSPGPTSQNSVFAVFISVFHSVSNIASDIEQPIHRKKGHLGGPAQTEK